MEDEQICISVDEASRIIGVGRNVMYKLIKQQGFPAVKIGRSYRVRKAGLEEWLKNHEGKEIILD